MSTQPNPALKKKVLPTIASQESRIAELEAQLAELKKGKQPTIVDDASSSSSAAPVSMASLFDAPASGKTLASSVVKDILRKKEDDERERQLEALTADYESKAVHLKGSLAKLVTFTVEFVENVVPKLASIGFGVLTGSLKLTMAVDLIKALFGGALPVALEELKDHIEQHVYLLFNRTKRSVEYGIQATTVQTFDVGTSDTASISEGGNKKKSKLSLRRLSKCCAGSASQSD